MSLIQFLIQLAAAIPVLDKWATTFAKEWHAFKVDVAEKKARETGNVEDLQNEAGKNK